MRALAIATLVACGGAQNANPSAAQPSPEEARYPALHWAPDAPTYMVTAARVRDGQRALRDVIESFGMLGRLTPEAVGSAARELVGLDPLGDELATKLGVDLDGGVAVFSEGWSPTFVIHLAAPPTTRAFFAHLHELGLNATTHTIDGLEVASAPLRSDITASWAIDGDWLWFHVALDGVGEGDPTGTWLVHARHRTKPGWLDALAWAGRLARAAKPLVGFWNSHATLATLVSHVGDAGDCIKQLETVERVGISIEGDGTHAAGRLAFDLGSAAPRVASAILPPPPGFAALAANAPLAVQLNVEIPAIAQALAPCIRALGDDPKELADPGVRAGRFLLETFDPDGPSGTGALALDLSSKQSVAKLVDEIPRLAIQTDRSFGKYRGRHVAIPFVASLDYVLDDSIALAAMGDGLLDQLVAGQLVAGTPAQTAPLFAIDIRPPGLPERSWQYLLREVFGTSGGKLATSQLLEWRDGHIGLSIDQTALVLDASGNRR